MDDRCDDTDTIQWQMIHFVVILSMHGISFDQSWYNRMKLWIYYVFEMKTKSGFQCNILWIHWNVVGFFYVDCCMILNVYFTDYFMISGIKIEIKINIRIKWGKWSKTERKKRIKSCWKILLQEKNKIKLK